MSEVDFEESETHIPTTQIKMLDDRSRLVAREASSFFDMDEARITDQCNFILSADGWFAE